MQDSLEAAYVRMAYQTGTEIVPVGTAWSNVLKHSNEYPLFWSGSNLANESGAYLSACVLFASLFQESPEGLSYFSSLEKAEASFLQKIAGNTVLPHIQYWQILTMENFPFPDFTWEIHHDEVQFIDLSRRGSEYYWNFGDGNYSVFREPRHQYKEFKEYEVCLRLFGEEGCPRVSCKEMVLHNWIHIFPNPVEEYLYIRFSPDLNGDVRYRLIKTDGRLAEENSIRKPSGLTIAVDTDLWKQGAYLMHFFNEGKMTTRKIVKE
jgi:hypothetical protein